jgi:uncharacterized protein (DUF488 family)
VSAVTPLHTIGYEGFQTDTWLQELSASGIEVVVDVRDMPLSRRRGFSKTALRLALEECGLEYVHVRALGNPKHMREALKAGLSFDEFAGLFAELLDQRSEELEDLLELAAERATCLVCFEEDPARCHRSLIAQRIVDLSDGTILVEHLRRAG